MTDLKLTMPYLDAEIASAARAFADALHQWARTRSDTAKATMHSAQTALIAIISEESRIQAEAVAQIREAERGLAGPKAGYPPLRIVNILFEDAPLLRLIGQEGKVENFTLSPSMTLNLAKQALGVIEQCNPRWEADDE